MASEIKLPKLKKTTPKREKKKILLLSDDLRMSSGVGTMSREIVLGTLENFDWVQLAGAITHPEHGKIVDMNDSVREETGVTDASLKIYPTNGYGNQELLREIMEMEIQMLFYIIQIQDFGVGYMIWNMKFGRRCRFFIIIYGMIGQLHNTMNSFMSLVI